MPSARLVTALQPHLAEPMMTHEFIDEDADLACQNLSDWKKQFLAEIGDKTNYYENNGNESDKALEMVDKLKTYCLRKGIADAHSQVFK